MTDDDLPPWPSRPALFLDLDGTLLEIAERPEEVAPSARLRALLPALPGATGGAVAVISGRCIEDIDRILAPYSYIAAGVHGLQRRGGNGVVQSPPEAGRLPEWIRENLEELAVRCPGLLVEDKGLSVALHYRARPELETAIRRFVERLQMQLPTGIEILLGRKVVEIKPSVMNKGAAIRAFMEEPPFSERTPVFVGDDVTDESGFNVVNGLGGITVKVGDGATEAGWRLANVSAVLGWLEHAVSRGPDA
ncbi:MAG TPA: trehalose-phosphatase [Gammaproteobacteria bacterium]|nr:trehalose-phosphatase [Gammaproteobacteria bacterium]